MEYIGRIENDKKLLEDRNGIVIFGAGNDLEKFLDKFKTLGIRDRIICVCDNNCAKQGIEVLGLEIVSPEQAFFNYADAQYVVYNRYCVEICEQLAKEHIENVHLIRG